MNDQQNDGTAAAALGAHSKDSHPATAHPAAPTEKTGYAAVDRLASSASKARNDVRQKVARAGGTVEQVAEMVREQPIAALLATGFTGLILGLMIGRR